MSKFSFKNISIAQIISFVVIVIALIFVSQNLHNVEFNLIITRVTLPLIILLIVTFVLGFFTAILFGTTRPDYEIDINTKKK